MSTRKRGTCLTCGGATNRTSNTTCPTCASKGRLEATGTTTATQTDAEVSRISTTPVKTLADLIRVCDIDTNEWAVERWTANKWDSLSEDGPPRYQVKATLKRKAHVLQVRDELAQMIKDAKTQMPRPAKAQKGSKGGVLVEVSIPDLHLGKLAWDGETGHGSYDSKEAQRLFREAASTLMARVSAHRLERIVFVVGNDFFHSDTKAGTTTGGTHLDNDSRFPKMFTEGRKLLTEVIEQFRTVAPVLVVMCPGNHDATANFTLGEALGCWFHHYTDVEVWNQPTPRKYFQYGQVMLGWTHGDKGKRENLPLLMATEQPAMFGATRFREIHTGHLHQTRTQEFMGVRVRISPALCAADAWHNENQFVGNLKQAEAFVWDRELGLIGQAFYTATKETLA